MRWKYLRCHIYLWTAEDFKRLRGETIRQGAAKRANFTLRRWPSRPRREKRDDFARRHLSLSSPHAETLELARARRLPFVKTARREQLLLSGSAATRWKGIDAALQRKGNNAKVWEFTAGRRQLWAYRFAGAAESDFSSLCCCWLMMMMLHSAPQNNNKMK